jgi:hypothetical protein
VFFTGQKGGIPLFISRMLARGPSVELLNLEMLRERVQLYPALLASAVVVPPAKSR